MTVAPHRKNMLKQAAMLITGISIALTFFFLDAIDKLQ